MKTLLQITSLVMFLGLTALPLQAYENDCCNDCQPTPAPSCPALNPIHPGMANLHRQVTDLQTYGTAPIRFTRIFNSRTTNFNDWYWDFGARQTWQHNWNYEVRQLTSKTFNQFDIKVRYPDGVEYNFKAASATSNQFIPPADCGDRLYKWSGSTVGYTLITPAGKEYDFWRYLSPKFHLMELRDGQGLKWTFTYNSDTTLKRIANAFGRWIELERTSVNGVLCITRVFSNDGRQVTYGYSPWTQTGSVVLTTVNYPAGEQAHYTWATTDPTVPTARPVLETASDPLFPGGGARTRYVYNYDARFNYGAGPYLVTGMVKEERNLDENSGILSLPLGGGHYPQILEGNGTEITRKFLYGLLTESRDGENRANFYTYTAGGFGYLETLTEPNGAVTAYNRDYAGRILSQTDLLGNTQSSAYNTAGFETSRTDPRNNTTSTTRDSGNRPVRIDYPDGTYETWTYNIYGQELLHRQRNESTISFVYYNGIEAGGKLGDLKTSTDPLGNVTTFTYADSGLRTSIKDARNNITAVIYNWRGKLETVTNPDGSIVRTEYDSFGNRTRQVDELGHAWAYTYDEFNHVASRTDPVGSLTTYEYGLDPSCPTCNSAEALTRVTLPSGKKTEYQYDRSWKRTTQTVGAGTAEAATTIYEYASNGDLAAIVDPRGKRTTFTSDLLHRRTSVTDPFGHATVYGYDAAGNKLTERRPDAGVTTCVFDSMNRVTRTTDPKNQVTTSSYDGGNNLITLTDPRDNAYSFEYDGLNRKTKMIYPDQSFERWTFDAVGNTATYKTRAGQIRTCAYDNRNRQTLSDWSDATPDVTSAYDAAGRLLTMASSVSILSYTYDDANQLLSETQQIMSDGGPKSVLYAYNADGNRASMNYPNGSIASYGYSARNQLTSVTSGPVTANYQYDLHGNRLGQSLSNGTNTAYVYDDMNRIVGVTHEKAGTGFAQFDYEYNEVSNRTRRTEAVGGSPLVSTTDVYGYDAIDQVTQVKYNFNGGANTQTRQVDYAFDSAGNRASVTDNSDTSSYQSNSLNQYTAAGDLTPGYDGNGNLNSQDGWSYLYDAQNRIISASANGINATFAYDSRNRCVSRAINGTVTFFYYDGWNLIEEQDSSSALIARYVNGAVVDQVIARVAGSSTYYYHQDALGSTTSLTDASGNVIERYTYDVFGAPIFRDGNNNPVSNSASGNRFLFTGREYIQQSALYDYRNRVYSPGMGRFLQTDPIRFDAKDLNLYRYVGNNAANWTDPMGLIIELDHKECTEQDWTEGHAECKEKGFYWVIKSCHWVKLGVRIGNLECGVWTRVVFCEDTSH
jgi:RHS repeat-associated protein